MKQWKLTPKHFIKPEDIKRLRKHMTQASKTGNAMAITRWAIIDFAMVTGARCSEIRNIEISDFYFDASPPSVFIREGKGHRDRIVIINKKLSTHIQAYLMWRGNPKEGHLFVSTRGKHYSLRGIQDVAKKSFASVAIDKFYSIHSLRHTMCSTLYRKTKDIRMVQRQAGHSNLAVTQVYVDLMDTEIAKGVENLY